MAAIALLNTRLGLAWCPAAAAMIAEWQQ